jgi:hypothetical protein
VAGLVIGCSKPADDDEPEPVQRAPQATAPASPVPAKSPKKAPVPAVPGEQTAIPAPTPKPESPETVKEIAAQETSYQTNTEFAAKVEAIFKISDIGSPGSLTALGRLFAQEKDPELRAELLAALGDIQGLDERKAALLAAGAAADQPRNVRQAAIDGLTLIDAKRSLPLLQALSSDADEEIREAAKDAIQIVQALLEARSDNPAMPNP